VLLEALYAGLPVVTTALGGALEIIDESCGVFVPPRAAELADALRIQLSDSLERERLGRNGRTRARALSEPAVRLSELRGMFAPVINGLRPLSR